MLISWIVLAVGQLSASLPTVASGPGRSPGGLSVPGEPSTLIEALIGVGLISAYLLVGRRVRSRRGVATSVPKAQAGRRKAA